MNWIGQIQSLGVLEAARRLGLRQVDRAHVSPCPACKGERRSRSDTRPGAVYVVAGGKGWKCGSCGAKGDVIRLVQYALLGEVLGKGDPRWGDLKKAAAESELCSSSWKDQWIPPRPEPPERRRRVDATELAELWDASSSVVEDLEVSTWLEGRGLDPEACAERDLCRALPSGPLPRWAIFRGAPWSLGWRCLVRAYDAAGELASIRARWVKAAPPPSGGEKTGAAAGGPGSAGGAVLACGLGRQVLERGRPPSWWPEEMPIEVVFVEGEPDWLSWASRSPGGEHAPMVLGLFNGAWDAELAARIPIGAVARVRTHHDEPGERYAQKVTESLWHRCQVFRSRRPNAAA